MYKAKKRYLYKFFKHIANVKSSDGATVCVSKKGFSALEVDTRHIVMVNIDLNYEAFEQFDKDGDDFPIDAEKILSMLRSFRFDDVITMNVGKESGDVKVAVRGKRDGSTISCQRVMPGMDSTYDVSEPELDFDCSFKVPLFGIHTVLSNTELKSDADDCMFGYTDGGTLWFTIALDEDEKDYCAINCDSVYYDNMDKVEVCFYIDYIEPVVKSIGKMSTVDISLKEDYPLQVSFGFEEYGEGHYLVAPRLGKENDT